MNRGSVSASRQLKIAGLIGLGLALALACLFEPAESRGWITPHGVTWIAAFWLASNVAAIALILLVAGLQDAPLLANRKVQRGTWVKMAGANLLIGCFAFTEFTENADIVQTLGLIAAPALLAFLLAARGGVSTFRRGWRYETSDAEDVMAEDARPPVVYLRSFQDDSEIVLAPTGRRARRFRRILPYLPPYYLAGVSPEQELALIMERVGPVVAIGRPGEPLPELGAARLYVPDSAWRKRVGQLMETARLVLIRTGSTPNLWWEVEQAMSLASRSRVVIIRFGARGVRDEFARRFADAYGVPEASPDPGITSRFETLQRLLGRMNLRPLAVGSVIYFDPKGMPREETIRYRMSALGWLTGIVRPYRDSLDDAMKRLFARLDLPWHRRRSQATAVFLGLLGSVFGLQYFYLGDRRRGVLSLVFFFTAVPFVLGLIGTVRLTLLEEREFQDRYSR